MKEKFKLRSWFDAQSPLVITRPALRETAACAGSLICGFVLSCGRLGGQPAPFALAMLAAAGGGLRGLTCLIGTVAGCMTMQPFSQGLQMVSAGILIYVCDYIFGALWVTKRAWFRGAVAGGMTALVGLIFLLSQQPSLAALTGYGQTVLLAALTPTAYDRLLRERKRTAGSLLALSTFFLGAAAIPLPFGMRLGCVGAVALAGAAARRADIAVTAALSAGAGLALDAALGTGFWTAALTCGGLFGAGVARRYRPLRTAIFAAAVAAALLYTGHVELALWLTLALGTGLSLLLPAGLIAGREASSLEASLDQAEERLLGGQQVLERLYEAIGADPVRQETETENLVFDRAAAKLCRRCGRRSQCWEKEARESYRLLQPVLSAAMERGAVRREDFPRDFSEKCLHLEELAAGLNRELDAVAASRQSRGRRQEERTVVSKYLLHLSRLLGENARQLRRERSQPREAFSAKLAAAARGRGGVHQSGDRGVSFQTEDGRFFAILCDGAGAGAPAAGESLLAVDTLTELIQAGMPPDSAMELLNGMYLLRDEGSFSTMDVLELSLLTGQGVLYKWGAAPTYVKSRNIVKRVGSAAPPPGLGSAWSAEVLRLNLWSGDMVVLVSDGAVGDDVETLIQEFEGDNVKALASGVIERAMERGAQDDMTAVVVRVASL